LVFPLTLPTDEVRTVLFRARGDNVIDFPLSLRTPDNFNEFDGRLNLFHGIFLGAVLVMCLFNLMIFFSIRELGSLLYVLYLGRFGLILLVREGFAFRWLWPQWPQWN